MSSRPPRVLICSRPGTGGAARVVEALLRRLPERGVGGTAALSSREGGELLDAARDHGWDVVRIDMARRIDPLRDGRAAMALRRAFDRHDVVHAHAAKAGALARIALPMRRGARVVYSPHGFYFTYHDEGSPAWRRYLQLERRLAPRTTLLHCVGDTEREIALRHGLASRESAHVLRNPVPPVRGRAAELPGDDVPLVVMAARLAPPKDPATFVAAAAHVAEPVRFVLIGDGELARAARVALPDGADVRFLPPETSVRGALSQARVAVLASRSEALPMFLAEALTEGVPVVATDIPGCRDVAEGAGLFVPGGDPAALGAAIERVLRDDDLHARLSVAARRRAREFDETRWLDGVLEMYARVTPTARRARNTRDASS